jgi:hypothetical protein
MTKVRGAVAVLGLLLTVGLLGVPIRGWGQEPAEGRTYGTTSEVSHAIHATSFVLTSSGTATAQSHSTTDNLSVFCLAISCGLATSVSLPDGALVTRVEIDACIAGEGRLIATLRRQDHNPQASKVILSTIDTNEFDVVVPACTNFPRTLSIPETIDNRHNYYLFELGMFPSGTSDGTVIAGVRIFYRLQVSPAPAVASFGDVPPGHPFFPFIEALAASGITSGCQSSPPLYCPDQALTRGQMAVFLSKALGLHFAP